jgi:serine/threonine protein kinase
MTNQRWDRVAAVFDAAVLKEPVDRLAFVRQSCADDPETRDEVEALLAGLDRPVVIDQPITDAVAELLGDSGRSLAGTRFGPFQVESRLGAGGMGEVYRATDTVLGRGVAIKLLPQDFATDAERLARLRREARMLAALSHPNIAAIYGLETLDSSGGQTLALVMELVEGPTLAEQLARGPLPPDEALMIARQIAEALDGAHQQGIVHRDLKPGNIKVRDDGTVKVLDFGLAKLAADGVRTAPPDLSPTITTPAMTAAGIILGTAAYMAPEQAKGKGVDKRADVWAFGVVIYEMLTGRRPFRGDDVAEVLAAVIKEQPDWTVVPEHARPLLQRCLEKDPRRRLRDIGDAIPLLEQGVEPAVIDSRRRQWLPWIAAAVISAAAVAISIAVPMRSQPIRAAVPTHLALPLDASWQFLVQDGGAATGIITAPMAVSPNGRYVGLLARRAGSGEHVVVIHDLDTGSAQSLPGTANASTLIWSPDSRFVAFAANGALKRIAVGGGPVATIYDRVGPINGGTWGPDGTIVYAAYQLAGLKRVPAEGGVPQDAVPVAGRDREVQMLPWFLPDGRHLLYTAAPLGAPLSSRTFSVYVQELGSADRVKLLDVGASNVVYADGYLLYMLDDTLLAQPFDPVRRVLAGDAAPVANAVQQSGRLTADGAFSASQSGLLVYQTGRQRGNRRLALVDRTGKNAAVVAESDLYRAMVLTPDGRHAAAVSGDAIWHIDLARGLRTRMTTEPAAYSGLAWMDDDRIAFSTTTEGRRAMVLKTISGAAADERLLAGDDAFRIPQDWSRDGRFLLFVQGQGPFSNNDLWVLPRGSGRKPFPLLTTSFNEGRPKFSPDRRWVAYSSNATGVGEVHVMPFVDPTQTADPAVSPSARAVRVSANGGTSPQWRADGRELYFLEPSTSMIVAVPVDGRGSEFKFERQESLFPIDPPEPTNAAPYDVMPDGQRFLIGISDSPGTLQPPTVILNWTSQLRSASQR